MRFTAESEEVVAKRQVASDDSKEAPVSTTPEQTTAAQHPNVFISTPGTMTKDAPQRRTGSDHPVTNTAIPAPVYMFEGPGSAHAGQGETSHHREQESQQAMGKTETITPHAQGKASLLNQKVFLENR